jgi:hypothetical protein
MKSSKHGTPTSTSVENITPFGIWILVQNKEYFLSYDQYPCFKDQTLQAIQNVHLLHGAHLHWPDLDVDLEIDNLENPGKYPLKSKKIVRAIVKKRTSRTGRLPASASRPTH